MPWTLYVSRKSSGGGGSIRSQRVDRGSEAGEKLTGRMAVGGPRRACGTGAVRVIITVPLMAVCCRLNSAVHGRCGGRCEKNEKRRERKGCGVGVGIGGKRLEGCTWGVRGLRGYRVQRRKAVHEQREKTVSGRGGGGDGRGNRREREREEREREREREVGGWVGGAATVK